MIKYYLNNSPEEEYRCSFDHSQSVEYASERLQKENYDVIVLDTHLADTTGLDTIQKVNKCLEKAEKTTPIIIYTAIENYAIGKEAYKLGIKDFLIKGQAEERELRRAITFATYSQNLPVRA